MGPLAWLEHGERCGLWWIQLVAGCERGVRQVVTTSGLLVDGPSRQAQLAKRHFFGWPADAQELQANESPRSTHLQEH